MFIFQSLRKALEMNQNQVAALLANEYKYFVHMCINGLKGSDYSKVIEWYKLLIENVE